MEKNVIDGLVEVTSILNQHSIEYLVIGGTALGMHGHQRVSYDTSGKPMEKADLDFWFNPSYDNYFKVLDALEQMGVDVAPWRAEKTPNPKKSFFKIEKEGYQMDLLPEVPGLQKFHVSFANREIGTISGVEIPYLNKKDLLESKLALSRPKDIDDINTLQQKKNKPK